LLSSFLFIPTWKKYWSFKIEEINGKVGIMFKWILSMNWIFVRYAQIPIRRMSRLIMGLLFGPEIWIRFHFLWDQAPPFFSVENYVIFPRIPIKREDEKSSLPIQSQSNLSSKFTLPTTHKNEIHWRNPTMKYKK
jgi:hypothetical protein